MKRFYLSATTLIHSPGKQWDDSFTLVLPLKNMPEKRYGRYPVEMEIGNHRIANGDSRSGFLFPQ